MAFQLAKSVSLSMLKAMNQMLKVEHPFKMSRFATVINILRVTLSLFILLYFMHHACRCTCNFDELRLYHIILF